MTMKLTETGESRIRGYLFVLGRSLRSFLPHEVADDAVREVESHIRERIEQIDGGEPARSPAEAANRRGPAAKADERTVVERVLAELGPPLRVAQAYSQEMTLDEAVTTGRFVPMTRALWHAATTSVFGFLWAMLVFVGWTIGISFLVVAVVKVIFPNNVAVFTLNGAFYSVGAEFGLPPGVEAHPFGYWVVPVAIAVGLAILIATQRASRRILGWMRSRRPPARLRVKVEVVEP
jgi:uncharacterized membrane protein